MKQRFLMIFAATVLAAASFPAAQEKVDKDIQWKIRREATDNSQIMRTMHFLTDVYGPRLTGSPNLKAAQDWIVQETTRWGLKNAHLEPWNFGHPGWVNERLSVHAIAPFKDSLVAEALAWTPGTNGAVTAQVVQMLIPSSPTKEALTKFFDDNRAKVKGKIVLVGQPAVIPVTILPPPKRREDNEVRAQYDAVNPQQPNFGGGGGPAVRPDPNVVPAAQVAEQFDQFLVAAGAAARINDAGREHGQIRAFNNRTFDIAKAVPTVVMRNEDFGRIARVLADGTPVELEVNIVNRSYPEGATSYNVVAEIPGTDKAQEVVMLGGHIDSWHGATGATDNAIGSATMMEAIRILQALGVKPRRTIRLALWSGEEQGLLGSQAYVKEHFGMVENPKPAHANFAGYFNIDSGTGRARGMSVFGPAEAATILREATKPFADNGFFGVNATQSRRRGGTDSTSFNEAGLPGIGIQQDPIEYGSHTWHTNLDTYERIIEEDAQQSAMVIAAAVYHLAMRDQMLPRLPKDRMPALPTP
ncbi:MAG TPA: M20/M25/M40 family metallo-hydrolase [Vicinamibacterales bacterium]|nr:M20/M25/M40 family metallo-hydrolase [Vicinamibacterales bacterium]